MSGHCLYQNRQDAGKQLALSLKKYQDTEPVVLGIPRGGVEVAFYVAKYLNADLSLIISQKLPHPLHPEYGIGAIGEDNITYIPKHIRINSELIHQIARTVKVELARRVSLYHNESPIPDLKNRTVILVDDGIATGVTMIPAIRYCHKMHARKIIVASPVSSTRLNDDLNEAHEHYILFQDDHFESVGAYYKDFKQLTDKNVLFFLKAGHHIHH